MNVINIIKKSNYFLLKKGKVSFILLLIVNIPLRHREKSKFEKQNLHFIY